MTYVGWLLSSWGMLMNVRDRKGWGSAAAILVAMFVCALPLAVWPGPQSASAQEQPKRVLMIGAYSEMLPATVEASKAIRERLKETSPGVDIFFSSLDLGRFPGKVHEERTARNLAEKYSEKRPDVVVALSREALRYLLQYRNVIAPGVPIVFCCMSAAAAAAMTSSPDVTGADSDYDWAKTLALAANLQPTARDVVVISGASDYDRRWSEDARRDLAPHLRIIQCPILGRASL